MTGIVFDMDDTLYKERHYRDSGYRTVARHFAASCGMSRESLYSLMVHHPERAFETISELAERNGVNVTVEEQLNVYRSHLPDISLDEDAREVLTRLREYKTPLGLITDGRAWGQLNKISALGLRRFFDGDALMPTVLDSTDKHSPEPFIRMERILRAKGADRLIYVGDNPSKDFHYPNLLGWNTVMLRDIGHENIHRQNLTEWPAENRPKIVIDNIKEILRIA